MKIKQPKTLFEKIWEKHVVYQKESYPAVLYIDAHLIHEVTTPQAFDGLRKRKLPVFRLKRTWGTMDHNVPTKDQDKPIEEEMSRKQVATFAKNCEEFGVNFYGLGHPYQGIVHIIGPELGITKPGMTIVCGDSHTSTHGAFGAIAFGIGTSEVEQVLASQCILQYKPKTMNIRIDGKLGHGVSSKDIVLYIISKLSTAGGTGYFVEYSGTAIEALSMEARMTICNMSIEMGARGGMIAPDETTFAYMKGRKYAPKGKEWDKAVAHWKMLKTDEGATYDKELFIDATEIEPMITYGTNPGMGMKITDKIPQASMFAEGTQRANFESSMTYMGLTDHQGKQLLGHPVDYVFLGSCTNARIEDFRKIASIVRGKKKPDSVYVFVVPGSAQVAAQMEKEGIAHIFMQAGFDLRSAGCSACLGMNEDKIPSGKYCLSTSNRNFQGRQGLGARTFLASPITAAVAAITGRVSDVREFL
ncbi:MAG: 3-isopropylmalate dehydratase large subunit [Patescibacteria group bacterium]